MPKQYVDFEKLTNLINRERCKPAREDKSKGWSIGFNCCCDMLLEVREFATEQEVRKHDAGSVFIENNVDALTMLRNLNAPNVPDEFKQEVAAMDRRELMKRVVRLSDWVTAYQKCLDGLGLVFMQPLEPNSIREIVKRLLQTERQASQQEPTELRKLLKRWMASAPGEYLMDGLKKRMYVDPQLFEDTKAVLLKGQAACDESAKSASKRIVRTDPPKDVWQVSPSLAEDGDYDEHEDTEDVYEHVRDVLENYFDDAGEGDSVTIEVRHKTVAPALAVGDMVTASYNAAPFEGGKAYSIIKLKEKTAVLDVDGMEVEIGKVFLSKVNPAPVDPNAYPKWLLERTHAVEYEYSPNCTKPYMVRFCGKGKPTIDKLPVHASNDAIGYGQTLTEAAEAAMAELSVSYEDKSPSPPLGRVVRIELDTPKESAVADLGDAAWIKHHGGPCPDGLQGRTLDIKTKDKLFRGYIPDAGEWPKIVEYREYYWPEDNRRSPEHIKPVPKYRPFASAEEFAPHCGKWIRLKDDSAFRTSITSYNDKHCWLSGASSGLSWRELFDEWAFEDGTPFGMPEIS